MTDATVMTLNGEPCYIRNFSNPYLGDQGRHIKVDLIFCHIHASGRVTDLTDLVAAFP